MGTRRDLSPAAVAEILHTKFTEHGTVTSAHRIRETLATNSIGRANEWTDRALTDGAVVYLVTHRVTGRVLATERPWVDGDPHVELNRKHAPDGLDLRTHMHYTLWADTEWAHLTPPIIDGNGAPRQYACPPAGFDTSSGHFAVAHDDVAALCYTFAAKAAEREAEREVEASALDAAGVGSLYDALTVAGVPIDNNDWHAMMTAKGAPAIMLTLRGQAAITALTRALTERNPA